MKELEIVLHVDFVSSFVWRADYSNYSKVSFFFSWCDHNIVLFQAESINARMAYHILWCGGIFGGFSEGKTCIIWISTQWWSFWFAWWDLWRLRSCAIHHFTHSWRRFKMNVRYFISVRWCCAGQASIYIHQASERINLNNNEINFFFLFYRKKYLCESSRVLLDATLSLIWRISSFILQQVFGLSTWLKMKLIRHKRVDDLSKNKKIFYWIRCWKSPWAEKSNSDSE